MKVVVVTGGRKFGDYPYLAQCLFNQQPFDLLIHGDATGADSQAKMWAEANNVRQVPVPALWKRHGVKRAGPIRNGVMADMVAALQRGGWQAVCLAFPGGNGTANMKEQCEARDIDVEECNYK